MTVEPMTVEPMAAEPALLHHLDEYFQVTGVTLYFDEFARKMREHRNLGCVFMRNASSFGGLFKFYPIIEQPALNIPAK